MGVSKVYLLLYNMTLALGWGYITWVALRQTNYQHIWSFVELPLKVCQTVALMEVVHAVIGIVRSGVGITALQVGGRLANLWLVVNVSPLAQGGIGFPLLLYSWSITEVFRYGHYFLSLSGYPKMMEWFRYTLFIVLYPMGLVGELICMYNGVLYVTGNPNWRSSFPEYLSSMRDYYLYTLYGGMIITVPIFLSLYTHMLAQRRKILGGGGTSGKKKSH